MGQGQHRGRGLRRHFFQHHQVQRRGLGAASACGHGAHRQVDAGEMAVGADLEPGHPHHIARAAGLVQGSGEVAAQALARHFQDVVDTGFAWRQLQVHAAAPMQVKNVAQGVHQRGHQAHLL